MAQMPSIGSAVGSASVGGGLIAGGLGVDWKILHVWIGLSFIILVYSMSFMFFGEHKLRRAKKARTRPD